MHAVERNGGLFLILEWEDRLDAGPRYYYIDGEPRQALRRLLERAGRLWKQRWWGLAAIKDYLQKRVSDDDQV
jgi:hypothetical protein